MKKEDVKKEKVTFQVNGKIQTVEAYPMERLLDVLRTEVQLTGTKEGCGEGECGACSIFMNGLLVNSCLVPVHQAKNVQVTTIEGLSEDKNLHVMQKAFLECGGAQCGICTPGMIMASCHLLEKNKNPSRQEIAEALSGNLCRCTGYTKILDSVEQALKERT
ncbi:MAG: (2Fe-2S)-binding protein [Bdellovibrionales bacterium]